MNERRIRIIDCLVLCICAAVLFAAGCTKNTGSRKISASRVVSLGEFSERQLTTRDEESAAALEALLATSQESDEESADIDVVVHDSGEAGGAANNTNAGDGNVIEAIGAPPVRPKRSLKPGDGVIVDSLIGQVNGRPIFADEFFATIEDQLIAEGRRLEQPQYIQAASSIVNSRLQEVVLNELFLAEAEAGLSKQEQVGLFAFMRQFQEQEISGSGGLETQKRQELELEGITLEEYIELKKNQALIARLIEQKIKPRVIVSWRDVEREYERRRSEFNPPAVVTLSQIRLNTERDADQIASVTERLTAGEAFADVANSLGLENGGEWNTFQTATGDVAKIELSDEIRQHLAGLREGDTTQPFAVGSSTWWLNVTKIEQPPARSIYDPKVQRSLTDYLYDERFREQFFRYRDTLFQRGIYDELNEMAQRLLAIAIVRYGP